MIATLNENIISQYSDGSKCSEFISDLRTPDNLTWEAAYWRAKYLFEYAGDMCSTQEMIGYINECFNQGLSVAASKDYYIDARRMAASLYIKAEQYELAANCIQAVLDITEDVPPEMFLDLNYAEIHTDTLRQILRDSNMFFADLHTADGRGEKNAERQKEIVRILLLKAAECKSKNPDTKINSSQIEREVVAFGLTESDEWKYYKQVLSAIEGGTTPPAPIFSKKVEVPKVQPEKQPTATPKTEIKKKARPIEIPIFPEDIVDDISSAKTVAPASAASKAPAQDVSKSEKPQPDLKAFEGMLSSIMQMVSQNAEQIAALQSKLGTTRDESETARIEAELEEGRAKNKELIEQLESAQAQLALSEEEKTAMAETIAAQTVIIDQKKSLEFSQEELEAFSAFERVVVFDTCSIENQLDLLDYITDKEMVRVPKTVNDELENHKKNGLSSDLRAMGQRALKAIRAKRCSVAFDFEDGYPTILPDAYRIKDDDAIGTVNDKNIFSVALRYKFHGKLPVVLISDDVTIQVWAKSEHIESMSAAEFVAGKEKIVPCTPPLSEEEFLAKKLRSKDYSLSPNEILVLQSYQVFTYGDFIAKTEDEVSYMKAKNGINLGNRLLCVYKKLIADYERRYKSDAVVSNLTK